MLANIYHRTLFLHYNPFTSQVQTYELDAAQTFKNMGAIHIHQSHPISKDLLSFSVIDNLLAIHNIDTRST